MADYSLLGSFSSSNSAASTLNSDLIDKLKSAEKKAVLTNIDSQLEDITGVDADTGDALDFTGESDTLTVIKAQVLDLLDKVSPFDLNSDTTAFDDVAASTTGTAAVFDAVDVGGLEPGTTNISVSQLAQKDVYQSITFDGTDKDGQMTAIDESSAAAVASAGININIGGEDYFYNIVQDPTASTIADMGAKSISDLADEINQNEKLIASVEQVGDDQYKLVVKSADSGLANQLTISQTNFNLGFTNTQYTSEAVADPAVQVAGGNDAGDKITINGVDFSTEGKTYEDLVNDINNYDSTSGTILDADADPTTYEGDTFNASLVDDGSGNKQIVITRQDGADVSISQTGVDLGFYNSDAHHVQKAQNLNATIDGIDYDTASNTVTIQGNLTMTAVETGDATINIQRDTSSVMTDLQSVIDSYNSLVDLVADQVNTADSKISDPSTIRSIMSGIKDKLFGSYGENGDSNLFAYGLDLDQTGHLSLDTTTFGDALNNHYDDIKNMLLGNTTDEDTAASDSTKYMGLGTLLSDYLDNLDSSTGVITRYENTLSDKKTELETERTDALDSLDTKYNNLADQFAQYSALISQMESSFASLSMMIKQSTASSN